MRIEVTDKHGYITNVVVCLPLNDEQVSLEVRVTSERGYAKLSNAGKRELNGQRYWRLYVHDDLSDIGAHIEIYPEHAEDFAIFNEDHHFAIDNGVNQISCFFLKKKVIPVTPVVAWQPLVGPVYKKPEAPLGRNHGLYRRLNANH